MTEPSAPNLPAECRHKHPIRWLPELGVGVCAGDKPRAWQLADGNAAGIHRDYEPLIRAMAEGLIRLEDERCQILNELEDVAAGASSTIEREGWEGLGGRLREWILEDEHDELEEDRDEARDTLREIAAFARGRTQDGIAHGAVLWREALTEVARRAEVAGGPAR